MDTHDRHGKLSIVLPAKNEAQALRTLLPTLTQRFPHAEIIVVSDGSTDATAEVCGQFPVRLIKHPYSMGNGAAIKTGARAATGQILVFMDADGQHDPEDIPRLLEKLDEGFEMVVGARRSDSHANQARRLANAAYNRLASIMTGYAITDLTSGFRAVRARHFKKFIYLLPNGFSYPTTSTMAFFRSGLPVAYVPIRAKTRVGKSHISIVRDGFRFFLIIVKIGALFSPMRLFLPISAALLAIGLGYYGYTYFTAHRFTNMSALLLSSSLLTFLLGILSEQISALHYKGADDDLRRTERIGTAPPAHDTEE
jgi:glycosyltransferase involved in cell wall biosynthesis